METDFIDIVAGVLQGDMLASYLFLFCLDYIFQMSVDLIKENDFILKKQEADDILQKLWQMQITDDLVLLTNTLAQVKSLLHNLEHGFYKNANVHILDKKVPSPL